MLLYLKQSSEDVKLKHRNVVVAGEIYSRLQSHGLHPFLECMNTLQLLLKTSPLHYTPVRAHYYHHHVVNVDTDMNISKISLIRKISYTLVIERMPPKLLSL